MLFIMPHLGFQVRQARSTDSYEMGFSGRKIKQRIFIKVIGDLLNTRDSEFYPGELGFSKLEDFYPGKCNFIYSRENRFFSSKKMPQ